MTHPDAENESQRSLAESDFNRRAFIKGASASSMMLMMGATLLQAEDAKPNATPPDTGYSTIAAPVACALIGCGLWGREILQTLALLPNAPVVAICDNYKPFLNRAKEFAPKAQTFEDYKELLALKTVEAVIVATPTHLHREIVEAALKAGKHVYCEAPLASTSEDALAIAKAAQAAERVNFQSGLQLRADKRMTFVRDFIRSGAIGNPVMARSQWHSKQSWRRTSPNPEREKASNWRLDKSVSTGLAGEIGIHQMDFVSWFFNKQPMAITGFGGILAWDDGRDVADTIQNVVQYPGNVNLSYDCSLANSFDADYTVLFGAFAAVMFRENKAWLFKEVDSPLLGWEIYASKEKFYHEEGIVLGASATKSVKAPDKVAAGVTYEDTPLNAALKSFIMNSHITRTGVTNFTATYGADSDGFKDYLLSTPELVKSRLPAAGFVEGYEATVTALKANDSIVKGQKLALNKDAFAI